MRNCTMFFCALLLGEGLAAAEVPSGAFPIQTTPTRLAVRHPRPTYKNYSFDLYENYP